MASKLLMDDLENQDIHALRLSVQSDGHHHGTIHISDHALPKLKQLQYLEVDGPLIIDGLEEDTPFPSKLVLLKCVGRLDTFDLALQDRLVVLHVSGVDVLPSSVGQLSALRIFIGEHLKIVPGEFGDLSQLEYLEFRDCRFLQSLPGTLGKLSRLEVLKFRFCHSLQLSETFGGLSNLKDLEFTACSGFRSLPQSFGHLSALDRLVFSRCRELVALPNSIGNLATLTHLEIGYCDELLAWPHSFGDLSGLKHLKLRYCDFEAIPNSFGKLSTLRHLELEDCGKFISMITFGQLSELQYLKISGKRRLIEMERLPESVGELTALNHLVLDFVSIRSIPDFIRTMQSLHTLELQMLPYIKELPPWLGVTGAALSCKMFEVQDGHFSLTNGEEPKIVRSHLLISRTHENAMEKVEVSDYEGALVDLCLPNLGVFEPKLQRFLLQERGIVRRLTGDLLGALEDLSAAVKVLSDSDNGHAYMYDCYKHRGYVKFLLGDMDGAKSDGAMALRLLPDYDCSKVSRSPSLGERSVAYLDFRLVRRRKNVDELSELMNLLHSQVMDKVRVSDFHGALACWNVTDASAYEPDLRGFFLQERGILKRLDGDLRGALEDLSAALEVYGAEAGRFRPQSSVTAVTEKQITHCLYNCLKHRGLVKFLLGDLDGAHKDGAMALKLVSCVFFGRNEWDWSSPNLGDELVTYMHFKLHPTGDLKKQRKLEVSLHLDVVEMVRMSDFSGALTIGENFDTSVSGYFDRVRFLQGRGVLKRLAGDLQGALDDLTGTLEILSEGDDCCSNRCSQQQTYNCRRHRGNVKFLLGDFEGALNDGAMALKLLSCSCYPPRALWIYANLGEELVTFMHFKLHPVRALNEQSKSQLGLHSRVMEMVRMSDFSEALTMWEEFDARVSGYFDRVFFLQERGVLKRLTGDLQGALNDLTATLEILCKGADNCCVHRCWHQQTYDCRRHLGYVKYLMGNEAGARRDAERCLAMDPKLDGPQCLGGLPVAFLEFRLKGRVTNESQLQKLSHRAVMEKVMEKSDFLGALAIWEDFDARVLGYYNRAYFLQERGILKRMAGDLSGALEDLTAGLEIEEGYDCLKHRGYVKYLMGDHDGARADAKRSMALGPKVSWKGYLGGLPVMFLEFDLQ